MTELYIINKLKSNVNLRCIQVKCVKNILHHDWGEKIHVFATMQTEEFGVKIQVIMTE